MMFLFLLGAFIGAFAGATFTAMFFAYLPPPPAVWHLPAKRFSCTIQTPPHHAVGGMQPIAPALDLGLAAKRVWLPINHAAE